MSFDRSGNPVFIKRQTASHVTGKVASPLLSLYKCKKLQFIHTVNGDRSIKAKIKKASVCHISSISVNPLQSYLDFSVFQDGGRPPSWIYLGHLDHALGVHGGLYHCAKFGCNRCSSFKTMKV